MQDYCGWIPTVGGRLSFSIIGDSFSLKESSTINKSVDGTRYLFCSQQRELLDSAIPVQILKKALTSLFYSYGAKFEFVIVATISDDPVVSTENLNGYICFIPTDSENWKNCKADIIDCYEALESSGNNISQTYEQQLNEVLLPLMENYSFFYSEFELTREGIASFTIPEIAKRNITSFFSDNKLSDKQVIHHACAQLFFYLKDVSHVHQHHHPRTDTIIDLHECDENEKWIQETIRSLYRKVLRFKRNLTEESCLSSLGVLAYLKTFRSILEKKLKIKKEKIEHLSLEDDNLEKSIYVALDKIKSKKSYKIIFRSELQTIVLGFIGLSISVIGLASLLKIEIKSNENSKWLESFSEYVIYNPLYFFGVVFIVVIFILWTSGAIPWKAWEWFDDVVRLVNTQRKLFIIPLLFLSAIYTLYLAINFLIT